MNLLAGKALCATRKINAPDHPGIAIMSASKCIGDDVVATNHAIAMGRLHEIPSDKVVIPSVGTSVVKMTEPMSASLLIKCRSINSACRTPGTCQQDKN